MKKQIFVLVYDNATSGTATSLHNSMREALDGLAAIVRISDPEFSIDGLDDDQARAKFGTWFDHSEDWYVINACEFEMMRPEQDWKSYPGMMLEKTHDGELLHAVTNAVLAASINLPAFFKYEATVAHERKIWTEELGARSMAEAEALTIDSICRDWGWDRAEYPDYEDDSQWEASGAWESFVGDTDGAGIIPSHSIGAPAVAAYRRLADGLSDMIEGGRLTAAAIPDDYQWLADTLAMIGGLDPSKGAPLPPVPEVAYIRTDLPKGLSVSDDPHLIVSHYECAACGEAWQSTWDSACDDECWSCGVDLSPVNFEDVPDCQCAACRAPKP